MQPPETLRLSKVFVVLCTVAAAVASTAHAAPATRLYVAFGSQACPVGACFPTTETYAGAHMNGYVYAVDATGELVPNYTGTVTFSSTDPDAVLPPPYTFDPALDGGVLTFFGGQNPAIAIFSTLGVQTLTVTDAANQLSGSASIIVHANQFTAGVPTLSRTGVGAAIALLAIAGIWAVSRHHV